MARLFGTDGVRGIANKELDCELAYKIGQAGAQVLTSAVHRPKILIGHDTRISSDMLSSALQAGICSVGAEAVLAGALPTPGIAHLTCAYDADGGVMISASHNSFEYNGIKWFNGEGYKLSDALEDEIEAIINTPEKRMPLPLGGDVGRVVHTSNTAETYISHLVSLGSDLSGLKVVLDCANGAASAIAPEVFTRLGARVFSYFNMPDGTNINDNCGSTKPGRMQQMVIERGADIGLAFDGDADRLIAVDEYGVLVDGDRTMAICAMDMKKRGVLAKDTVVITVMSNMGMKLTLQEQGIKTVSTTVGDRYVLECMLENGYVLGGEQSGHIIFSQHATTGDGILSALLLTSVLAGSGQKLSTLSRAVKIFPQVQINVQVANDKKNLFSENAAIIERIAQSERKMGDKGRVLVRTSGTEPLVRVMLEGEDDDLIKLEGIEIAQLIADVYDGKLK